MRAVAALFVELTGPYNDVSLEAVGVWDIARDARLYPGPHPVVAHPPCQRWGKYWSGGPSAKARRKLGDDDGCFASAIASVRRFGGVLEHPAYSHAWKHFSLSRPPNGGGWIPAGDGVGFTCHVEQGHYGHRARKATWLYAVGTELPVLRWGPCANSARIEEGFHSTAERHLAREQGRKPLKRLSTRERVYTPPPFRDLLISMARSSTTMNPEER